MKRFFRPTKKRKEREKIMELKIYFHFYEKQNLSHTDYFESKKQVLMRLQTPFTFEPPKPFILPFDENLIDDPLIDSIMTFEFQEQKCARLWEALIIVPNITGKDRLNKIEQIIKLFDDYVTYEISEVVFRKRD